MTDIVNRLRDRAYSGLPDPLLEEAANEIERLRNGAVSGCEAVTKRSKGVATPMPKEKRDEVSASLRHENPEADGGFAGPKSDQSDRPEPIQSTPVREEPDITTRLRQTRADMIGTDDEQHYWTCQDAADAIADLRAKIALVGLKGNPMIKAHERTPQAHATPSEGTELREGTEPVAWGVLRVGGGWVSILANEVQAETSRRSWDGRENWVHEVVPLYRSPTLTDAERAAVEHFARCETSPGMVDAAFAATLWGLLERLK